MNSFGLYKDETEFFFKNLNQLFNRIGKMRNPFKFIRFHDPLKPIQIKGRRVPLHLLPAVKKELDNQISQGHIKKLESCEDGRLIVLNSNYLQER